MNGYSSHGRGDISDHTIFCTGLSGIWDSEMLERAAHQEHVEIFKDESMCQVKSMDTPKLLKRYKEMELKRRQQRRDSHLKKMDLELAPELVT